LWLDMLGYKDWLSRQDNLEYAEDVLVNEIRFAFSKYKDLTDENDCDNYLIHGKNVFAPIPDEPNATFFDDYDITSVLISDTIIVWTRKLTFSGFVALVKVYQLLAYRLSCRGLPLRGALSYGSIRYRNKRRNRGQTTRNRGQTTVSALARKNTKPWAKQGCHRRRTIFQRTQ